MKNWGMHLVVHRVSLSFVLRDKSQWDFGVPYEVPTPAMELGLAM